VIPRSYIEAQIRLVKEQADKLLAAHYQALGAVRALEHLLANPPKSEEASSISEEAFLKVVKSAIDEA
jgi:enamine deaminase RidA (YjgF/YER057c/UK114 family)